MRQNYGSLTPPVGAVVAAFELREAVRIAIDLLALQWGKWAFPPEAKAHIDVHACASATLQRV